MKKGLADFLPFSLQEDKWLSTLSTFGIGGKARYYSEVQTVLQMQQLIKACYQAQVPYLIVGKGSNSLFDDRGFDGLVIGNRIDFLENSSPGVYHVGAGYSFSLLGTQTARQNYSGLEFAAGIPASVGGAIYMNAGANGQETSAQLHSVDYIDCTGSLQEILREQLEFSYRFSSFQNLNGALVGATFCLKPVDTARAKQLSLIAYRKETQPYAEKSAGCVFRNPTSVVTSLSAGALIEKVGLKGYTLGEAKVSERHANFIVNTGQATAQEIKDLVQLVKQTVKQHTGIELESEVRFIPFQLQE